MSYLGPVRLHFSGVFQAAPSTVNNDLSHFDNATFQPSYQEWGRGASNGWWNPQGDAAWRLIGCQVTGAWMGPAMPAADTDAVRQCAVTDTDSRVAGKLVDLDPEQQLVSEIWGLEVRICLPDGTALLRSKYRTAAFADIWGRATSGGGDTGAGAMYQSVLYDLEWGDLRASPFLQALRAEAGSGLLSIKFNVDGYNMDIRSPRFTRGRIVGTIGAAAGGEPEHFVLGRHLLATQAAGNQGFFAPQGQINFCAAVVDEQAGKIYLDLGNALPTQGPGGPMANIGTLSLGYPTAPDDLGNTGIHAIDTVPYLGETWYTDTAGVAELPAGRTLTAEELAGLAESPLYLTLTGSAGPLPVLGISEPPSGVYARPDRLVYRMNPGDLAEARVYATQWGKPYAGASVVVLFDPSQLQMQSDPTWPGPAAPRDAVDYPARVTTDAGGVALLPIRAADPGNPRHYIDGQIYGVRPVLEDTLANGANYPFNPGDFVSLLVWDAFDETTATTWWPQLQPIFQQYENLYPVMKRFLRLGDYQSVCDNVRLLQLAFGLPMEDPNTMPVTRDLSDAKRRAILRWLGTPGADGKPLLGVPPPSPAETVAAPMAAEIEGPSRGGKYAAMTRRVGKR